MQSAKLAGPLSARKCCAVRPSLRGRPVRVVLATPRQLGCQHMQAVSSSIDEVPQSLPSPGVSDMAKFAAACGVSLALVLSACGAADAADTGGRMGGSSFNARRQASSSTSVSTHSTHVSHTTVVVSQPTPMFGFMPIGFMPMGMGFGYSSPASTIFSLLALVLLLFIIVQVVSMVWGSKEEDSYYEAEPPVTVVKLQLGLLGLAKNIRSELDSLAMRADTSTPEGLHYILQETVLALMRHPDYFVYAASSTETVFDESEAERKFNSLSLSERAKIRQETLSNVSGYTSANFNSTGSNNGVNELVLVTIMIAAEGQLMLPNISTAADAREALGKLGGIPSSAIMGVELLWTPQAPGDSLTQTQLLADYPQLMPV